MFNQVKSASCLKHRLSASIDIASRAHHSTFMPFDQARTPSRVDSPSPQAYATALPAWLVPVAPSPCLSKIGPQSLPVHDRPPSVPVHDRSGPPVRACPRSVTIGPVPRSVPVHDRPLGMRDVAGRSGYRTVPGEPGYFSCVTLTKRPQQQPLSLESRNRAHLVFANVQHQRRRASRRPLHAVVRLRFPFHTLGRIWSPPRSLSCRMGT